MTGADVLLAVLARLRDERDPKPDHEGMPISLLELAQIEAGR